MSNETENKTNANTPDETAAAQPITDEEAAGVAGGRLLFITFYRCIECDACYRDYRTECDCGGKVKPSKM